jgi:hypothetical protein
MAKPFIQRITLQPGKAEPISLPSGMFHHVRIGNATGDDIRVYGETGPGYSVIVDGFEDSWDGPANFYGFETGLLFRLQSDVGGDVVLKWS